MDTIGLYGGILRRALTGDIIQTAGANKTLSENLMGFSRPLPDSIVHNLAENFEFRDEGRTAIFKIRRGIKWSDGVPFTVDDILFWYYDMTFDDNARPHNQPVPPSVWVVDGKPIDLEKIDDHTLKVSSSKPLGRVLNALCSDVIAQPKHHLSHLHPRYNPEASYEEFREKATNAMLIMKPGMPRLSAWVPVEWFRGQRIVYERNPYYWKVDTAGNQLPYVDRLEFAIIQDPQVILLKFVNGELNLFGRYSRINMFPTLRAERNKGQIQIADHRARPGASVLSQLGHAQTRAARSLSQPRCARCHVARDQPRRDQPDRLSRPARSIGVLFCTFEPALR